VLQFCIMSHTITIRVTDELAGWLRETARSIGTSQGKIIRDQIEKAQASAHKPFMDLAGVVSGQRDLSSRKGFSRP